MSALRNFKPKSGHSEGGFFAQGAQEGKNGLIFGETPPPPGQKRKWESWEAPWYSLLIDSFVFDRSKLTVVSLMLGSDLVYALTTYMLLLVPDINTALLLWYVKFT